MTSMIGATGSPGQSTGSKMRGLDPRMKHISGAHRFQQFTPEQMSLFQQLLGMSGPDSFFSKLAGGDEEAFQQMEAPALKQFSGLQGNLASRFSGMGMGARRSSGFQNASNQAAQDFASKLQAQRTGLQRQSLLDLANISQMLLGQQPYGLSTRQQQPSFLESLVGGGALGSLGSAAINKFF